MRVRDLDPNRMVYLSLTKSRVAHLRPNCVALTGGVAEKLVSVLHQDMPVCKKCRPDYSHSDKMKETSKNPVAKQLEKLTPEDLNF